MVENIILVTIDSLRWDRISSSGHNQNKSTTVDTLINDGVSFRRAFATGPGTQPSFPGILTGTYLLSYEGAGALIEYRPRMASELQESELSTAGFQSNPFLSEQFNYDVGFDTYRDYQNPLMGVATKVFPRGIEMNNPKLKKIDEALGLTDLLKRSYQRVSGKARPYVSADVITDDALNWLKGTDEPFFCWAHYMDVHHPCYPPRSYRKRYDVEDTTPEEVSDWYSMLIKDPDRLSESQLQDLLALYDAAIDYVDDQVGLLIDYLYESGRYENTLIVLTSDHGEMFGEHNEYGKPSRMYDELLRVPLIVANGPGHLKQAADELVSLVDIPPLIHDALGLEIPDEYTGRIPGKGDPRTHIIGEDVLNGNPVVGARSANQLYEYNTDTEMAQTYAVRAGRAIPDPNVKPEPQLQDQVWNRIEQFGSGEGNYDLRPDIDSDIENRLEDLGYL